jgi:hypothetical protein
MGSAIYRDSLSAWKGLREIGGLDLDDRDQDLVAQLKDQFDPGASDLEAVLARTTMDVFLQALFQTVQPFVRMFRDVLLFFERAGARHGQSQWRVRVGDEFIDLRHFEEFLKHWDSINHEVEVPALDRDRAFIFNSIRREYGGDDYLIEGMAWDKPSVTGVPDVDTWLAEYFAGRYGPFPRSLYPDQLPPGLDDAARVVMAALSVIRKIGMNRDQMLSEHMARSFRSVARDAFHPWTIAQNETDFWLRSHVVYLANIIRKPAGEREEVGTRLARAYSGFARRRFNANIDISDLERLLSLPAWKRRYELYGVWVATEVIGALEGHDIRINHENGELRFAFAEARIAEIESARPKLALISERRSPLSDPIGKSRSGAVQPDFGIWTCNVHLPECVLVVEVKHYKKRSRRNFCAALVDYARAHRKAKVVLVNYGPVGSDFTNLPPSVKDRCNLIGYLNPENPVAQLDFRRLVRSCVGDPITDSRKDTAAPSHEIIAIDTSKSMSAIIRSDWFWNFVESLQGAVQCVLIDQKIRDFERSELLRQWFHNNELGEATSLSGPVSELLRKYDGVIVVTDQGGLDSLRSLKEVDLIPTADHHDVRRVRIRRNE